MAVKSVFPHCVRTMHILPNLVTIFKYSSLFAFYSILAKVITFQVPKHYLIKTHDSESRGQEEAQQRDH